MCGMRIILRAGLLAVFLPSGAVAGQQDDLVSTFATCTGRFSALMEHQWLMSDPRADETQARRAAMVALLESVTPMAERRQALARRIDAKFALAGLLTRVDFNRDPADAAWAAQRVEVEIAHCDALMLG